MKLRHLVVPMLATLAVFAYGCSRIPVEAVAPGPTENQSSTTTQGGQYVLYRATGMDHAPSPTIERVWVVTASRGEPVGFRFVTDKAHKYDDFGGNHLEAYIGGQVRDLGTFDNYDAKYIWAGSDTDLNAYFRHAAEGKFFQVITLQ